MRQDDYPLDLDDMARWVAAHAAPGCRVLEIGCGDGALTERLAADGFDVTGIDPHAPNGPRFVATTIEEFSSDAPFDVAVSSVAMHHVADLEQAAARVAESLVPGGLLLLREFDRDDLMNQASTIGWWHHQMLARQAAGELDDVADDRASFAAKWLAKFDHHVIQWPRLRSALESAGFTTVVEERTAYLFRHKLTEAVRPLEEELIAAGRIRPVGVRWTGRRT